MEKLYISPLDFPGSDSERIQAAVNEAVKTDIRVVVIPQKDTPWALEKAIDLPGDVTVILDGATVESAGIAFQNSNAHDPATKALGGEQYEIYIIGRNGATLKGAEKPQIYLSNVKGYRIAGLTFAGGMGLKLHYARYGKAQKLRFIGSTYGVSLSEGCNNNIIEDIEAETRHEAVTFRGADTPMFGRGKEMAETIVSRILAKTESAAVSIFPGPCETYNLIVKDITASHTGVLLGCKEDTQSIIDITLRNIRARELGVLTRGACDGVYMVNAGKADFQVEPTRCYTDPAAGETPALPQLEEVPQKAFITPNDPAFFGETDADTIQNALNAAVQQGKMLLIPRYNARTGSTVWNIGKAVILPSGANIGLLKTHLRQQDFCYDNMFRAEGAENIIITGIGDAILDGGIHNQLKSRNAEKYGI